MRRSLSRIVGIVLITFSLGGCTITIKIVSEWHNPAYASASFKRIMVGGLGGESSVRRNFEDEFLLQLRAAGIDALPSYRYIADGEKIDETKLKQAAQKIGADAVLFARSVQVDQRSQLGPSYFPYTSFGIFGSHVGASWRSEEHTSELQSRPHLVCRLQLEKKNTNRNHVSPIKQKKKKKTDMSRSNSR